MNTGLTEFKSPAANVLLRWTSVFLRNCPLLNAADQFRETTDCFY